MEFRKKIMIVFLLACVVPVLASDYVFDTRIGMYSSSLGTILFRDSRLAYDTSKIMPNTLVRAEYFVLDGIGLTGGLDSFRIGLQAVCKVAMPSDMVFLPYLGVNISKSRLSDMVLSGAAGFDFKSKFLSFADGVVGCDVDIYSDTYMLDYFAGLSVPIMNSLSVDLLYNGMLFNSSHKIGFSGRVNFEF